MARTGDKEIAAVLRERRAVATSPAACRYGPRRHILDHELLERGLANSRPLDLRALKHKTPPHQKRQGEHAMSKTATIAMAFLTAWVFAAPLGWAQPHDDKERAELAKALKDAQVPLQQGVTASVKEGKPISAKYEVEDGKLQLSVYTMKGDKFSEVIVDHRTGKVAKAEPITKDEDLKGAKAQSEAMAKAKRSLDAAASDAVKGNAGFRAVSVMPTMKDEHPVAEVMLLKGTEWKTVTERLD
jgi:hypothetical protein